LVDSGVQHTVTSITRYIVFIITVLVGFSYVGLGQHIGYLLAALAVSIGWVLKDPINDFISYFIILVQRPVKIGDYVQIDKHTQGVVRKITPRSVILRRKNSTTLIVPNSYLINQSIENWNFSRSFIALNDIFFTIDYEVDPEEVQHIIFMIVQEHPNVLRNPKPIVRLDEFADYGFVFLVRAYVSTLYVLEMWDIASDIRIQIVKTLHKHGMKIAVPVRVIRNGVSRHKSPVVEKNDQHGEE
jgi:potassium efflux system protein